MTSGNPHQHPLHAVEFARSRAVDLERAGRTDLADKLEELASSIESIWEGAGIPGAPRWLNSVAGLFAYKTTKRELMESATAWSRLSRWFHEQDHAAWADVASDNAIAARDELERFEAGEVEGGGVAGAIERAERTVADTASHIAGAAGLGDPFDPSQAKGGENEDKSTRGLRVIGGVVVGVAGLLWAGPWVIRRGLALWDAINPKERDQ